MAPSTATGASVLSWIACKEDAEFIGRSVEDENTLAAIARQIQVVWRDIADLNGGQNGPWRFFAKFDRARSPLVGPVAQGGYGRSAGIANATAVREAP